MTAFLISLFFVCIAEMGDKTQLVALAIVVGTVLGKRLPERAIKYGAAAVFILSGVYTLVAAFVSRA